MPEDRSAGRFLIVQEPEDDAKTRVRSTGNDGPMRITICIWRHGSLLCWARHGRPNEDVSAVTAASVGEAMQPFAVRLWGQNRRAGSSRRQKSCCYFKPEVNKHDGKRDTGNRGSDVSKEATAKMRVCRR